MKNTTKYQYWFVRFFCRQNIYAYMKHDPDFFFMHACISPTALIRIFHKRKALLRITEVVLLSQRNNIVLAVETHTHTHTHIYHRGHETLFHEPSKQILHPGPSLRHSLSRICCASRPYLDYTITSQSALSCRISLGPYQPDMPWPIKFFLILTSVPSC